MENAAPSSAIRVIFLDNIGPEVYIKPDLQ
jgi:hypothetical protein